jgi:amino acid transporter
MSWSVPAPGVRPSFTMSETESQSRAQHGLRRQLGLGDLVLAQVLCVVGSSWVGVAAGLGRAQMLFWLGAMLVFYLPMAASVIGLNREMPLEGGLYVWAHRAFGDLGGFLTAWNILIYAIAVTAAILYAIPTEIAYFIGPSAAWLPENRLISLAIADRSPGRRGCRRRGQPRRTWPDVPVAITPQGGHHPFPERAMLTRSQSVPDRTYEIKCGR